jgi:hypothetical protein
MEANVSRYHGKATDEIDWTEKQRQKRVVAEYLAALEAEAAAEGDAPGKHSDDVVDFRWFAAIRRSRRAVFVVDIVGCRAFDELR